MKHSIVNDLRDKLRERLEYCTFAVAAEESGIDGSVLHKFAYGDKGLRPETLDKLGEWLGYKSINWR